MIEVQNLVRTYGDFVAVRDVSFSIRQGEIVGLLGHNGAGKTTVMRMLTGYLEPSGGSINVDGLDGDKDRLAIQERIGYLPENAPLYPEQTVVEYLQYVANLRQLESGTSAIKDAIERTGLGPKALSLVSTLSKGYKQRVGVAQAIIHNPDILILDEPTNGLDPAQINEMRSLIEGLSESATVILSTHILQEVEAVCDRVIIMVQGEIGLDKKLSDLTQSQRLVIAINGAGEKAPSFIKSIPGVISASPSTSAGESKRFVLELEDTCEQVAPVVAKAIVAEGWNLFHMSPEQKSLEAIFREISSGEAGRAA